MCAHCGRTRIVLEDTADESSDRRKMDLRGDEERIQRWLCETDIESNQDEEEGLSESEKEDNLEADVYVGTDTSEEESLMSSDEEVFVSRRSRKRRFILGSDDDTSDAGQLSSEPIQLQQQPQELVPSVVIRPNKNHLYGKSGYKWSSRPRNPRARTSSRNVIHVVPGPVGVAKENIDPKELFLLFISDEMINEMITYTNTEIDIKKSKYKQEKYTNTQTSANEVKALLGLLIQSAAIKSNHLPTRTLFDHKRSASTFKACMSAERFDFLLRSLRFDDKTTRTERRASDKFAPFRQFWEAFISNCKKWYKPSSYVTIDEQLVGFRGRCPFRMYLPNKPNKYGVKLIMMADSKTKYVCNAIPYLGKGTNPGTEPLASYLVKEITEPIHGSNRNLTMDNWFTSVPLASEMLQAPYKLTVVCTLRSNKREIPQELKNSRARQVGTSIFCFNKDMTLVSYKPKSNKVVYLLSTTHDQPSINDGTKKPEIIHFYNATKGAVDTVDQMCSIMGTGRKTNRWPLCLFYDTLNISIINSYDVYVCNMIRDRKKPLKRREFALQMADELMKPWLLERYNTVTLKRDLKKSIEDILNIEQPQESCVQELPKTRKICGFCPAKKRRMTKYTCTYCKKAICGEHTVPICSNCKN